jgi:hypothetical membrane protein
MQAVTMHRNCSLAGVLFLVGSIQYIVVQLVCEAVYPNYSVSANFISDLGVWGQPTAAAFNASIVLLGVTVFASAFLLRKQLGLGWKVWLFLVAGAGYMLIGFFPEDGYGIKALSIFHASGAIMGFVVGAALALSAVTFTRRPFKQVSAVLGALTLVAAVLFIAELDLGLGVGGIERVMTYPLLLWFVAFGIYSLGDRGSCA